MEETGQGSPRNQTVRNEYFLSPEPQEGSRTPIRMMSNHSLAGEDIVLSGHPSAELQMESNLSPFTPNEAVTSHINLSPFTPSEATTTPPSLQAPVTLSPPPLSQNSQREPGEDLSSAVPNSLRQPVINPTTTLPLQHSGNIPGTQRPPRAPHGTLQPSRSLPISHGGGHSNSDYSFLSALTESSLDFSIPRRRTVSWDMNDPSERDRRAGVTGSPGNLTNVSHKSTPPSLLQPILSDAPPASIVTNQLSQPALASVGPRRARSNSLEAQFKLRARNEQPISSSSSSATGPKTTERDTSLQGMKAAPIAPQGNENAPTPPNWMVWNPPQGPETGSFVLMSDQSAEGDDSPEQRPRRSLRPGIRRQQRYTVCDVTQAVPPEGEDETLLINRLDSQGESSKGESKNPSLLPLIPDEIILDEDGEMIINEDMKRFHTSSGEGNGKRTSASHFADLTKKLLESPLLKGAASSTSKTRHTRVKSELPRNAGEQLYDAAETLFGRSVLPEVDVEQGGSTTSQSTQNVTGQPLQRFQRRFNSFGRKVKSDMSYFADFLEPHRPTLQEELFRLARIIMLPSLGLAFLLYYVLDNPPNGYNDDGGAKNSTASYQFGGDIDSNPDGVAAGDDATTTKGASQSWWVLFLGVRQIITLELARVSQLVVIDFLIFRTKRFPRMLGPSVSLLAAQAKGWPYILFSWMLWDLALLFGNSKLAHHWLFWQNIFGMMNDTNPHGDVTSSNLYQSLIYSGLGLSVAVAIKRYIIGQEVSKRLVRNYRTEMSAMMQSLIVINEVSYLSTVMEIDSPKYLARHLTAFEEGYTKAMALDSGKPENIDTTDSFDYSEAPSPTTSKDDKGFSAAAQVEIADLLEQWEGPELQGDDEEEITMGTILQFRRALEFISGELPFSAPFGSVRTREACIESSQSLFERLRGSAPGQVLDFDVLCLTAKDEDGNVDRTKVKELIRVFRPNRNGQLSKLDFVKSIDSIYKEMRLLLASIKNSSQIDQAYETILNTGFYTCAMFALFGVLGVDIQSVIIALSSIIVSFAFMIGTASSKYLEGILFVLVRRPYDIGDRISINEVVDEPSNFGGDGSWIVEKVDLYTTTARLGSSREVATFANGSLANLRIINMNRSEKPNVRLLLKFSVDSTLQQRQQFKALMTAYIKERPREWIKVVAFRSTRVETDLGFVEYVFIVQHRERWQNLPAVLISRGEVFNKALELQKELHMKYKAPRVPIDIRRVERESPSRSHSDRNHSELLDPLDEPKKEK